MNKVIKVVLIFAAIVSTLYLLMLGFFAVPVADDLGWARQVSEYGSFGFVRNFYYGWQGRFTALLIDGTLCKLFGWSEHLLTFSIIELLVGVGGVYLLLRDLIGVKDCCLNIFVSILCVNLFVMALPEIGTFYWLCTANYIHEVWFTLYLIWFIWCCHTNWLTWLGMLLCSLYLSACSENYPPTLIFIFGVYLLYRAYSLNTWKFWSDRRSLLIACCIVVLIVGFLAMLLAPGNSVRLAAENQDRSFMNSFSMIPFLRTSIKATALILIRLLSRGWYFLMIFPLFLFLGNFVHSTYYKFSLKNFLISFICLLVVIYVSIAAAVFGTGWYATMRANCYLIFLVFIWLGYIGLSLGILLSQKVSSIILTIALTMVIGTSLWYLYSEYPIVKKYHDEVIGIHHKMQLYVAENRTERAIVNNVEVPHLKSSYTILRNGIQTLFGKAKRYDEGYFPYEPFVLSSNPADWRNKFYKSWLYAQFDIVAY